jgi:hypothetical protein
MSASAPPPSSRAAGNRQCSLGAVICCEKPPSARDDSPLTRHTASRTSNSSTHTGAAVCLSMGQGAVRTAQRDGKRGASALASHEQAGAHALSAHGERGTTGNAISLPCYLWPADLGFRAALTMLIEDRVRVSEHLAMRPGAGHLQHRGCGPCREKRADVALEPQTQPTRPWPARRPPARCWPALFTPDRGTTMSFRSRTALGRAPEP